MFRWKGIIFLAVVIGIFIILSLIFTDRWLEHKIESTGTSVAGARVEVDNLDLSLTDLKIRWSRLQVCDRRNTMKNLIETGICEFDMEFWPLLSKKVIIENFAMTGFRTNTDRQTDGKIDLPPAGKTPQQPGFIEKTANRLIEQVGSNATDQFSSFKQKVNVDSIMALLQIQSVSQITALQADLSQNYENWQNQLTQLNYENDLQKLNSQVKNIDVNKINTPQGFQSALKSADKIEQSLDSLNKSVKTSRAKLTSDLSNARQRIGQVDDWISADYQRAMAMAKLPDLNMQNIGKLIFGTRLVNQVNYYLNYAGMARAYTDKFKSTEPEKEAPPRLKGQNIYFYNEHARPDFWIKNMILSGQTNDGIALKGEVKNIVSDQRQIGKTTEFFVGGSKESAAAIALNGVLDYLQDQSLEQFNVKYDGFSLANTSLSESKLLPNKIQKGSGAIEAQLSLHGDQVESQIRFTGNKLSFDFGEQDQSKNEFDQIVQSIVRSIDMIDLVARIKGTKDNLVFSLNSNLDDLFVNKTKEILSKEVDEAKNKIKARVDTEVAAQRKKLDNLIKEKESQLNAQVEKYEQMVNQQKEIIETKKKEIEKSITKDKGKLEKKAKDLLKF
jgi:uncharacterized protein (TIGR03545 family)